MWKIGDVEIKNKVVLAPMAGITYFGYRRFMEEWGVSLTFSEMISDMGLLYENKETEDYLMFPKTDIPCVVQLFGSEPENLAKAAKIVQKLSPFTKIIDINMACPVPKVTKNGAGSSLLSDPKKIGQIVRRIREETGLLVTAKIRLGIDKNSINFLETIEALEEAGVSAISLHARTAKDLYYGTPNFELVKNLRNKMTVPLIISGNIFTKEDAKNALDITGADAVMVARGGMGNPWLIKEIVNYLDGKEIDYKPSLNEQIDACLKLAQYTIEEKGETKGMRILRGILPKFFNGFANCKLYRLRLSSELTTYQSLLNIIEDIRKENEL